MRSEELLEDGEGAQFREGGHVETVVGEDDLGATVTLVAREAEEVHGVEGHTHEGDYARGVSCTEEVSMQGREQGETAGLEVEESARHIAFKIGIEAYEAREPHHEDEMEVGRLHRRGVGIEPQKAALHIAKEWQVGLLVACGVGQEFSREECHG